VLSFRHDGQEKNEYCRGSPGNRVESGNYPHLYYETSQRIELHAINKLCSLFECQVGDLFEWIADDEGAETLSVGK
jgi:hypothetical protein